MNRIHFSLAALLLIAITGCPESEPQKAVEQPFAGQHVTLLVPKEFGLPLLWQAPLTEWSAQTGAQAELKEYEPAASTDLAAAARDHQASLILFPIERIGELLGPKLLGPLPESQLSEDGLRWTDLFAGVRENLGSPGRQATIVPLSCPVLVCYYRADLLKKANLSPPATWEDYQQLLDRLGDWAPGKTAVEPWGDDFRATMFFARAAAQVKHPGNFSFFFDVDTGLPIIDGPGFVKSLEQARAAVAKMPESIWKFGPADCRAELLAGRAALGIGFEQAGAPLTSEESPGPARGDDVTVGFSRLPGARDVYNRSRNAWEMLPGKQINTVSLTGFGGFGAAVTHGTSSTGAEATINALTRLAGDDLASGFPHGMIGLCRESQTQTIQRWTGPQLAGDEAGRYVAAVAQSLRDSRMVIELPVPRRNDFRTAMSEGLIRALRDGQAPAESLKDVATAWSDIVKEIGSERVRDTYRAALGMTTR